MLRATGLEMKVIVVGRVDLEKRVSSLVISFRVMRSVGDFSSDEQRRGAC